MGFLTRLKEGMTKTRQGFIGKIEELVGSAKHIDEQLYEELEEILIQADVGVSAADTLVADLKQLVKKRRISESGQLKVLLKEIIANKIGTYSAGATNLIDSTTAALNEPPAVFVMIGVNGTGKTTTIGKLAYLLKKEGKNVIIAAGDTFRAAAIDQLEIWSDKAGCDLIKHKEGADPAAVVFDAVRAAKARKADVLIVDTAGRLHNKANLMEELKKILRVISREMSRDPDEVFLVVDATTGQNAISQARLFNEAVGISGIILTKLDGTAKGGVVIGIKSELDIPVKYIGIGEKQEDLREFAPDEFLAALFDEEVMR